MVIFWLGGQLPPASYSHASTVLYLISSTDGVCDTPGQHLWQKSAHNSWIPLQSSSVSSLPSAKFRSTTGTWCDTWNARPGRSPHQAWRSAKVCRGLAGKSPGAAQLRCYTPIEDRGWEKKKESLVKVMQQGWEKTPESLVKVIQQDLIKGCVYWCMLITMHHTPTTN